MPPRFVPANSWPAQSGEIRLCYMGQGKGRGRWREAHQGRSPVHKAQVLWAVKQEMARTTEDVLSRRTRTLLLDAKESLRIAPLVAAIMAEEMNRSGQWIEEQVKSYNAVAKNYFIDS